MLDLLCEEAGRLKDELAAKLDMDRQNNLPSEESRRPLSVNRRREHRTIN
jgi:hypothetical protein